MLSRDFPDDSSRPTKTVALLCFDRKPDPTTRFGVLGWGARFLATLEMVLEPEHPAVGQSLDNLAALYYKQGRYAEAEPLFQRALAIRESALGSSHPDLAMTLNNYATLLRATQRGEQAAKLEARATTILARRARDIPVE